MKGSKINQFKIFESKEDLLSSADIQAINAPPEFRVSIKFYFIARYFVAIFESRYQQIPINVWNEYRNALDHFFRHMTTSGKPGLPEDKNLNLKKMEGHLQRATLDILKILSHFAHDSVLNLKKEYDFKVLRLVDNGSFIDGIDKELHNAEKQLELAKVSDLGLGNDDTVNAEVLNLYLDAAFGFDKLKYKLIDKAEDIRHAQEQYDQIHNDGHIHSFFQGIKIHLISHLLAVMLGGLTIGLLYRYYPKIAILYSNFTHPATASEQKLTHEALTNKK